MLTVVFIVVEGEFPKEHGPIHTPTGKHLAIWIEDYTSRIRMPDELPHGHYPTDALSCHHFQ